MFDVCVSLASDFSVRMIICWVGIAIFHFLRDLGGKLWILRKLKFGDKKLTNVFRKIKDLAGSTSISL